MSLMTNGGLLIYKYLPNIVQMPQKHGISIMFSLNVIAGEIAENKDIFFVNGSENIMEIRYDTEPEAEPSMRHHDTIDIKEISRFENIIITV